MQYIVKFWRANRLDQEFERDPKDVAREFIEAVKDGYDLSTCRVVGLEYTFRLWLCDREGLNSTWEETDSDALMDALAETITPEEREFIWAKLTEGLS